MTVYRDKDSITYRYDFWWRGERYKGTTFQTNVTDARAFETDLKARIRRQAGGLLRPSDTPRFTPWAGIYYEYVNGRLRAPQHVDDTLRVVLRFWGAKPRPSGKPLLEPDAPYHDLRLADPIEQPDWIEQFERWIAERGVSAQTRNHYFSVMSRMYRVALLPKFRKQSGIQFNPFAGIPKARTRPRQVTLTVDQIRAWIRAASYHVRLAAAIAALAPKLRVANILALEWKTHLDPKLTFITVHDHKTSDETRAPLVAPISAQLRHILQDAQKRNPGARHVVVYRGEPVQSIVGGVAAAFTETGIPYGRDVAGGATFHTLRHSMATLLAELDEPEAARQALMGHEDPRTMQKYTHLRPMRQRKTAERLSRNVRLLDLVTLPHTRATRTKSPGGSSGGMVARTVTKRAKSRTKTRAMKARSKVSKT